MGDSRAAANQERRTKNSRAAASTSNLNSQLELLRSGLLKPNKHRENENPTPHPRRPFRLRLRRFGGAENSSVPLASSTSDEGPSRALREAMTPGDFLSLPGLGSDKIPPRRWRVNSNGGAVAESRRRMYALERIRHDGEIRSGGSHTRLDNTARGLTPIRAMADPLLGRGRTTFPGRPRADRRVTRHFILRIYSYKALVKGSGSRCTVAGQNRFHPTATPPASACSE